MDYIKYGGFTVPMPKLNKKETRGGTRQCSGAKPKYNVLQLKNRAECGSVL